MRGLNFALGGFCNAGIRASGASMNAAVDSDLPMALTRTHVRPADRLGFTLLIAALVHLAIILGVGFTYVKPEKISQTLEITLAPFKSDTKPKDADFLAQDHDGDRKLSQDEFLVYYRGLLASAKLEIGADVDREAERIQAARRKAAEYYDWNEILPQVMRRYQAVLGARGQDEPGARSVCVTD